MPDERIFEPKTSFMKDEDLQYLLVRELTDIVYRHVLHNVLDEYCRAIKELDTKDLFGTIHKHVLEFMDVYSNRPFSNNEGGSGFHNSFWLYLIAKGLQPEVIIESGVWKGHTTWLLHQACPNAEIHAFDIDTHRIEPGVRRINKITVHECDWLDKRDLLKELAKRPSMVFLDDHISHARRILEATDMGFDLVFFDDNPPVHLLYAYGRPPTPTLSMIMKREHWVNKQRISWNWGNGGMGFKITPDVLQQTIQASEIVKEWFVFPDVASQTRYGGYSFLSFAKLATP